MAMFEVNGATVTTQTVLYRSVSFNILVDLVGDEDDIVDLHFFDAASTDHMLIEGLVCDANGPVQATGVSFPAEAAIGSGCRFRAFNANTQSPHHSELFALQASQSIGGNPARLNLGISLGL